MLAMIRINLLPLEKRKPERTPLPRFALIIAGAALATGILVYLAYVWLDIRSKSNEIKEVTKEIEALKPAEKEYNDKDAEKKLIEATLSDLGKVQSERMIPWATIIDALWEVVHQNPRIWLEDFKTIDQRTAQTEMQKANPKGGTIASYGMTFRCGSAGPEAVNIAKFRKDLQTHPVLSQYFNWINSLPEWTLKSEKDAGSSSSLSFNVGMYFVTVKAQPQKPAAQTGVKQ